MLLNLQFKKFIVPLIALTMAIMLIVITASPAFADDSEPAKPLPGLGKISNESLRGMLLRERSWYDSQAVIFREAYDLADWVQSYITWQKEKGRDVTALENALTAFYSELVTADLVHQETAKILGANGGFNAYFNVIDRPSAGRTVLEARSSLKDTHFKIYFAVQQLKKDYHAWRRWMLRQGE